MLPNGPPSLRPGGETMIRSEIYAGGEHPHSAHAKALSYERALTGFESIRMIGKHQLWHRPPHDFRWRACS